MLHPEIRIITTTTSSSISSIAGTTTATFLILLLWSLSQAPSSSAALTVMRDDRIYRYVGKQDQQQEQSNHLNTLPVGSANNSAVGKNQSEAERVDFESVIPEPAIEEPVRQREVIKDPTNDSYLLKASDKQLDHEMSRGVVVVAPASAAASVSRDSDSWGAGSSSSPSPFLASSSSSAESSAVDERKEEASSSADKEEEGPENNKADMQMNDPPSDSSSSTGRGGEEETVAERTGIPDRVFIQITHVPSVEEFMKQFVVIDNSSNNNNRSSSSSSSQDSLAGKHDDDAPPDDDEEVHVESLFRGYDSPDSSSSASSSSAAGASGTSTTSSSNAGVRNRGKKTYPVISSPAGCDVEMRTIEIKDPVNRNELYYPWCVRLPRCSGCCPSSRLQCVPTNISFVEINVSIFFSFPVSF